MTLANAVLAIMFVGLTAYAIFGGADFGAGFWDLLAGGTRKGMRQRDLIEHAIAPVWEANHVWLIFVLVILWTGFPGAFAAVASTAYIPLTLAAFGMIARGSAFAFRKSVDQLSQRRLFGAAFAFSSVVTPYFLGAVVGAIASGRIPAGIAQGDPMSSWINPTSALGGVLAVGVCAYIAAVFLCGDAVRDGAVDLAEQFRFRALATGGVLGALALLGILVLRSDAPVLSDGLLGRGLPAIIVSALFGAASIVLLVQRRYTIARVTATLAVIAVLWGWALAQYPYILPTELTIDDAAAGRVTLQAMVVTVCLGSALLVPALIFMYRLFQRAEHSPDEQPTSTEPVH